MLVLRCQTKRQHLANERCSQSISKETEEVMTGSR